MQSKKKEKNINEPNSKTKLDKKLEEMEDKIDITNENNNENINIFNGFNEEEQYVTYHVYPVTESDTLDKILEKYQTTKEELAKFKPARLRQKKSQQVAS